MTHANIPNGGVQRQQYANTLVSNGWEPIPIVKDKKAPVIRGWNKDPVDIGKWFPIKNLYGGIGIRNGVAIDCDSTDPVLAEQINMLVVEYLGPTPLVRIGQAPKTLHVYRGKLRSTTTLKIKNIETGAIAAVDILGDGKQFVSHHRHPGTGEGYDWIDQDPLDVAYDQVPEADPARVTALVAAINEMLKSMVGSRGWVQITKARPPGEEYVVGTPIPLDKSFYCDDYEFSAGDLLTANEFPANGIRCSWDNTNRQDAGCWFMGTYGIPFLIDWGQQTKHYIEGHAAAADPDAKALAVLTDGLQVLYEDRPQDQRPEPTPRVVDNVTDGPPVGSKEHSVACLEFMLEYRGYNVRDRSVWDLKSRTRLNNVQGLAEAFPYTMELTCHDGKKKQVPLTKLWLGHKKEFTDATFRPDSGSDLWTETDYERRSLNVYIQPEFPEGGDVQPFLDHIRRMVPDDREHTITLDWISALLSQPHQRLVALLMVAPDTFGVGRGLLFQALSRALGPRYCRQVEMSQLTKSTYQSQYTEFMEHKLLIHVPEIVADHDEGTGNVVRKQESAYEALKGILDPGVSEMEIIRKRVANTVEQVFHSTFIASNHAAGVAMPANDRRSTVVENVRVPMTPEEIDVFTFWMGANRDRDNPDAEANIGALIEWAHSWTRTIYVDLDTPPRTAAKDMVAEASMPAIMGDILDALYDLPGSVVTVGQIIAKLPTMIGKDASLQLYHVRTYCKKHLVKVDPNDARRAWKYGGMVVRPWLRDPSRRGWLLAERGRVVKELAKNEGG